MNILPVSFTFLYFPSIFAKIKIKKYKTKRTKASALVLSNYLKARFGNLSIFSNIIPVPTATQCIGFSAINTGTFSSSAKSMSIPCSKAPPPVRITPRSMISADNSGGVRSNTPFAACTITAAFSLMLL